MKTEIKKDLNGLPDLWISDPHKHLNKGKAEPGFLFLLKTSKNRIHLCRLSRMLPSDVSCRAVRLSDWKYIRLENQKGAKFMPLDLDSQAPIGGYRIKSSNGKIDGDYSTLSGAEKSREVWQDRNPKLSFEIMPVEQSGSPRFWDDMKEAGRVL